MLYCARCAAIYPSGEERWRCECGGYLLLRHNSMFRAESLVGRPPTIWRYREALGIAEDAPAVSLGEGMTPLVDACLGGLRAGLKVDYLCPTGSYKDRGSSVMLTQLRAWGLPRIVEDSSGNAGASIAAYAALAGIPSDIYVPASTSAGKAAQIELYGANMVKVAGTREDTARAALDAGKQHFYASHNWSPWFLAGMKTAAYEIAEQMDWCVPDWVVTPAGGGGLLCGLYLGFHDLLRAGITKSIPRLVAVQADACDPIYRAWQAGLPDVPAVAKRVTVAEGISVAQPVRGPLILQAIRESGGMAATVSDEEIWAALPILGGLGLYVEPTAAAAPAALLRLRREGAIPADARVVVLLTGSGLKATDKIVEHFAAPAMV
jgi:threonine synthase